MMPSVVASWIKSFHVISVNSAYDIMTSFSSLFRYHGNHVVRNASNPDVISVEMSYTDLQLFVFVPSMLAFLAAVALIVLAGITLSLLYKVFFVPMERIKRLGSIGYINGEAGSISKKDLANMIRKRRKIGDDLPPVYPNGWFRLLDSHQLRPGEVKEVCAMGEHFAVFRSQSGKVGILDAYCPHMGGNLAVGGRVKGECLECPFHGWVFDQEGTCVDIPYSDKVPSFAKTKSWPSKELNGTIFVWYHCDGVAPEWEIPEISQITDGTLTYKGRVEHHVNSHIQDLPENGSDQAHLGHLHIPCITAGNDLSKQFESLLNIARHIFKAEMLGSSKEEPHVSKIKLTHSLEIFNKWKFLNLVFNVYQIGPGMVHLHFKSFLGDAVFVQNVTPLEPLHQVMTHKLYATWKIPLWIARMMLLAEAIQVDRDVMIWNNKTFQPRPKLVKEDKLIAQYRRWFSQFYNENSPKLTMKSEGNDW